MIVSYCPKKNKIVNLLSTLHSGTKVDTSYEQRKPEVILTYNEAKAGVDTMDQMTRTYSFKRKTRRWPLVVFYKHVGYIGYKCLRHLEGTQSKLEFQQVTQEKTISSI